MKHLLFIVIFYLFYSNNTLAQIGVGTTEVDESSIFEITSSNQGILFPQLSTTERNAINSAQKGLIIFNTDTQTLEINRGTTLTPQWKTINTETVLASHPRQSAKFENTDISTNLNTSATRTTPLLSTTLWNDNESLFTVSNNTLTVNQSGRYKLIVNISLRRAGSGSRKAPEAYITVNNIQESAIASTAYIRNSADHIEASLHLNEILELNQGDVIAVICKRGAQSGTVRLRSVGSSNFYIEKLD